MPPVLRRELTPAPPPRSLLRRLPPGSGVRLLEAGGGAGWGSWTAPPQPACSRLALEPEVEFRGGLPALMDAFAWLDGARGPDADAALLIGWLSYDLGREFERLPSRALDEIPTPPVCLAGYRACYRYDPQRGRGEVVGSDPRAVERLLQRLAEGLDPGPSGPCPRLEPPKARTSDSAYRAMVRRARDWIRAGDIYQVNLSRRLDLAPLPALGLVALYDELTARAPAPFASYLDAGNLVVLSNSPERLLRVRGAAVETCPIKGTRPRGRTPAEDRRLARQLLASPKDRAEHVMIVDLERNDLGRVCQTGSVRVRELAGLRSFPTVHHLVSVIEGRLCPTASPLALLRAAFPGGSITGAPKIRAMEIIEELEPARRGVYTGAIGYFDAAGGLDLSIAIRTAVANERGLHLQLGGGIVADSDPEAELRETRDKGAAFARLWGAQA